MKFLVINCFGDTRTIDGCDIIDAIEMNYGTYDSIVAVVKLEDTP